MIEIKDKSRCSGCHACVSTCPKGCIKMISDDNGFLYPVVDEIACVNCGACNKSCYFEYASVKKTVQEVFAVSNLNENIRLKSSSGGVFYSLAKEVIDNGGVVFGAAFDERFNVVHRYVEKIEDIYLLQGSKYVQSVIGDCFKRVKELLKLNRKVLFTGTPCQINGLLTYLKEDHPNLLTMDFICHGVPSPMVWRSYLDEMIEKYNSPIKDISFRSKEYGWKKYSLKIKFDNGDEYFGKIGEDPYLRSFIMDVHLRESCYNCNSKGIDRPADITVADFWGIGEVCKEMNDDKGVSVVILRGEKATHIFEKLKCAFLVETSDINTIVKLNPSIISSASKNQLRQKFLILVRKKGFRKAYKRYCDITLYSKIYRKLKL